jgi:hypothetical protein
MIVRALIQELLDCDMDAEVVVSVEPRKWVEARDAETVIGADLRKHVVIEAADDVEGAA